MMHVQNLGKRKAYSISDGGEITHTPESTADDSLSSSALAAVKSMKSSMSLTSREASALCVKKSVVEMLSLLDVVTMLRQNDILKAQRCSRSLTKYPVGMLEKHTTKQAAVMKANCFTNCAALLGQARAESARCVEERRLYASSCERLQQRWHLSLRKPNSSGQHKQDIAVVDCSFSKNGGKYVGGAWTEPLLIGTGGAQTGAADDHHPQYTVEISVFHKVQGEIAVATLWDLLTRNFEAKFKQSNVLEENLSNLEAIFEKKAHDCLCRELFDHLAKEALDAATDSQIVSDSFSSDVDSVRNRVIGLESLIQENPISLLQLVHFSRTKISVLLTDSTVLCFRLVAMSSISSTNETACGNFEAATELVSDAVLMDVVGSEPRSDGLYDSIVASISAALLTVTLRTIRVWDDVGDRKSYEAGRLKGVSCSNGLLFSTKKLVQFHVKKYKLERLFNTFKNQPAYSKYRVEWVEAPDSIFCFERIVMVFKEDMIYEVTVKVNSLSVLCWRLEAHEPLRHLFKRSFDLEGSDSAYTFFSTLLKCR